MPVGTQGTVKAIHQEELKTQLMQISFWEIHIIYIYAQERISFRKPEGCIILLVGTDLC